MARVVDALEQALKEAVGVDGRTNLDCRKIAEAALQAIRDPHPEMVRAGVAVHELEGDRIDISPEIPKIWRAMIDAALGERSQTG